MSIKTMRLWLTPGMGVKRYVLAAVMGSLLVMSSVGLLVLWSLGSERHALSIPLEDILSGQRWQRYGWALASGIMLLGISQVVWALTLLNASILSNWVNKPSEAVNVIHQRVSLAKGPRIVALGGGTGLSNLLRGLRAHSSNITAVVAVSDDGGSSGRLRDAFDMPPPGDLVDCLAALSDYEMEVGKLLEYRFERGKELRGHTFGNLLITTLTEVEGDFAQAIRVMNRLLNICGAVYPVSSKPLTLHSRKRSGQWVKGESHAREVPGAIEEVRLEPSRPPIVPEVEQAILAADMVVLGPGSLFTSTIPPTLVPVCCQALQLTQARLVYICNMMTEAGETDGYSAWDHVQVLYRHLGRYPDWVLVNNTPVDAPRLDAYEHEQATVVRWELEPFARHGIKLITRDLLSDGPYAQHDPYKLAAWLIEHAKAEPLTPLVS